MKRIEFLQEPTLQTLGSIKSRKQQKEKTARPQTV